MRPRGPKMFCTSVARSYVTTNGSVGLKLNVAAGLLVNFNLRFNVTSGGLTDRLAPLLGLEYGF